MFHTHGPHTLASALSRRLEGQSRAGGSTWARGWALGRAGGGTGPSAGLMSELEG